MSTSCKIRAIRPPDVDDEDDEEKVGTSEQIEDKNIGPKIPKQMRPTGDLKSSHFLGATWTLLKELNLSLPVVVDTACEEILG